MKIVSVLETWVLPFTFRSLVSLKLTFVFHVRKGSPYHFFPYGFPVPPSTMCWKDMYSPLICSASSIINHVLTCIGLFLNSLFYCISLFSYPYISTIQPYSTSFYNKPCYIIVKFSYLVVFLQECLGYLWLFIPSWKFYNLLSSAKTT